MSKVIYRGYDITLNAGGTSTRHFIYKDGKEVYSLTSTEEQVYDWIDKEIRRLKNETP